MQLHRYKLAFAFLMVLGISFSSPQARPSVASVSVRKNSGASTGENNLRHFHKGYGLNKEPTEIISALETYQMHLAKAYRQLDELRRANQEQEGSSAIVRLFRDARLWSLNRDLRSADRALLTSLNIPQNEIDGDYRSISEHSSDQVLYWHTQAFIHLLAGISRKVDRYIEIGHERRELDGGALDYSTFCFSTIASQQRIDLPPAVRELLRRRDFTRLTNIFRTDERPVLRIDLKDTVAYSLEGVAGSCKVFGAVNNIGPEQQIVIYKDVIRSRERARKFPSLVPFFEESVYIHETLHWMTLYPCALEQAHGSFKLDGVNYTYRSIQEGVASIGTLAAYANAESDFLFFSLVENLEAAEDARYRLVYDLFYRELFARLASSAFEKLKVKARSETIRERDLPKNFRVGESRPRSSDRGDELGELKVDGKAREIFFDLDYSNLVAQLDLLEGATAAEVLVVADKAFTQLARAYKVSCKPGTDTSQ